MKLCPGRSLKIFFGSTYYTVIGCFGASAKDSLSRITGKIELTQPVFSNLNSKSEVFQKDAVELSKSLKALDITYLDPPYNQHPYGSNYFMLNLILKNKLDVEISPVSGITQDWNHSDFISFEEMTLMLSKYGKVKTVEIDYNTFRGSKNLHGRDIYVSEYLFVLEK